MARVDVDRDAAAGIDAGAVAPDDFAGSAVERGGGGGAEARGGLLVFVDAKDFDAGTRRIEVADVQRVAMAQSGREESAAVVVDDHRVINDLVAAVGID